LLSDVEVGAYLSGGLDSGSIAAIAARRIPGMKTFTIGFELGNVAEHERHFDERAAAESISAAIGTTQIEMVIGQSYVTTALPKLAFHMEEPRVGQSYPNYSAADLASRFVKVVLSGTGGDEILGGYPWRYPSSDLDTRDFSSWHYQVWNRAFSSEEVLDLLDSCNGDFASFDPREVHRASLEGCPSGDPISIQDALFFEAKYFLPGLLAVEDRLSMAHGLEARVPFLDNDLVDFCVLLPRAMRVGTPNGDTGGISRGRGDSGVSKRLLRTTMSKALPPQITSSSKQGFAAPDTNWLQAIWANRASNTSLQEALAMFDGDTLESLISSPQTESKRRARLWTVLMGSMSIRDVVKTGLESKS